MSIFKFEFAHTIKQIWVIGEVMPEETSALGQLYDTLGVFGVVQGANEVMLRTLEREMGDTDQHIRQWLQGDDGKYQPVKIDGTWHTYFIDAGPFAVHSTDLSRNIIIGLAGDTVASGGAAAVLSAHHGGRAKQASDT